jgi:hypothetical protein
VGTATTTEGEIALITALGGLQVGRGLTADQMKLLSHDQRGSSKRSTRKIWQLVQWQIPTRLGSIVASNWISPQWQLPVTFIDFTS